MPYEHEDWLHEPQEWSIHRSKAIDKGIEEQYRIDRIAAATAAKFE